MSKSRVNPFPVRLDPEMRAKIERLAKKERRSLNAWMLMAVEERLERSEKQEDAV